jgi:ubiquinone/menaquinone biosynthesis C-methylase UbiE
MIMPEPTIPEDIPPEKMPSLLVNWHLGSKARRYMSRRRFSSVAGAIGRGRGGRVLDVGCGWGYSLFVLRAAGFDPIGIDIVQNDFYAARRVADANGKEARLVGADVSRLPFVADVFEAVTSVETFEHIYADDRAMALEEVARVLVPGGILSFSTPNFYSFIEWGKRMISRIPALKRLFPPMCYPVDFSSRRDYHPYAYHKPIRRAELVDLLSSAGFERIETRVIMFIWKNTPGLLLPLLRPLEVLLEGLPLIRNLGSTLVVTARKAT